VLYYLIRKRRDIQKRRQDMSSMSVTSNGARGGHHRASDFIYASPYEFIDKNNDSEIYIPMSVSLRMTPLTPPPLPQRNNNYSPPPRMAPISASRSSPCTPEMTQAFPNCTPSPLIATKNNELQVVIEVHNEQDPDKRPSSLQQLQEMLDLEPQKLENINQNTMDGNIPQEKDGFLSRKVGYEIERRLVKAVQVRTLRKKREKKGHYHYYPFYEKSSNYNGFWGWLKHHLSGHSKENSSNSPNDHVYSNQRRKKRRKRHHRFCIKCVTSSFASLFRVLKEPIDITYTNTIKKTEVKNPQVAKDGHQRALSRNTATEATRTPTPKMLLDMKSGAIHWPVYQFGGQSGSGMLLSAQALRKNDKKTPINNDNEPGRENFQLVPGGASQLEIENKSKTVKNSQNYTNQNETKSFSKAAEEDERKLIGWLQVRNPNNRKKTFLQVVNPKPEGPFRKAPWHGNVHVMKF